MPSIIKIENLTKRFTDTLAVDSISFEVQQGDLFAFLGTNGAGKSTTINMICTLLEKTSGKVFVDGLDLDKNAPEIRNEIGIVFQENVLGFPLTVEDNLYTRGKFSGLSGKALKARVQELRKLMWLEDTWKRPYGKLSGGQKRKCEIARALISAPKLLILDVPTTGLDPQTRKSIWETPMSMSSIG
ncbi:MAG TPA: hypothetical protein DDZ65_04555 [Firmicutes bacterium]|nr:hypothetical protein [Bacillota bacterium]